VKKSKEKTRKERGKRKIIEERKEKRKERN